jgi:signal transduction histidine kinase
MTIKNKLRAGFGFLFLLALICCCVSIYFLNRLSADARNILKDNYKTVQYTKNIVVVLDASIGMLTKSQSQLIEKNLALQELNITEPGEKALTDSLITNFNRLRMADYEAGNIRNEMKRLTYKIMQLNIDAIEHKDAIASATAHKATLLVAFTGTFLFLVAFSFVANFPGYIANPIKELTEKIKEVSKRNYHHQLNFKSNDEFGELGQAFNEMTKKLEKITEFQQLNDAKTNFIATISHELKTPISSIKMSLKLLEDTRIGDVNTEQRQLLENIDEDARRLLQITGELLDMAQVETGKLQLNFGSTHPKNIVDYAVKALKTTAEQKHLTLNVQCDENLPDVHADLDKTTWVLINLLSNAIKYSHEKAVVDLIVKKYKSDEIEFSVQDHGRGIDQRYLSRIFERYFKIPGATVEQTGTGLGLAIAKDFIEAQAGKIGVESEIGEGSRFYFTLKRTA